MHEVKVFDSSGKLKKIISTKIRSSKQRKKSKKIKKRKRKLWDFFNL